MLSLTCNFLSFMLEFKVLQYTGGHNLFSIGRRRVQPSQPQKFHFQARASFFNTFMPVSLNIDLVITLSSEQFKNFQKRTVGRKLITTV